MKRVTPMLLFSASLAVGCTQLEDSRIEARQRRMARAAYVTSPGACNGMPHSVDYAKGFEEGYYDVASGGDGCPPALPPQKYWGATYNSPVGQEHVKAWFQGFRDGAAAAKADGAASYGTIYISDEHRNGIKKAEQPANHATPPAPQAITPQAKATTGVQQAPISGPAPIPMLLPPNSSSGGAAPKPPMSDALKTPPLKETPIAPPPSAKAPEPKKPEPMAPAPTANLMLPKQETPLPTIMPVAAPPASADVAPIPAVSAPATKAPEKKPEAKPAPEPIKLKLPEFELPSGFTPEAGLGEPKALGAG